MASCLLLGAGASCLVLGKMKDGAPKCCGLVVAPICPFVLSEHGMHPVLLPQRKLLFPCFVCNVTLNLLFCSFISSIS